MKGIDISEYQGNVDFDKVKKEVDFVILRLGWIGNKNNHTIDKKFTQYYNECHRLGIPVGVYVYCYSNREDTAESGARWTLEQLQGKELQIPIYIDMEDASITSLGRDKLTNIVIAFNTIIENAGKRAGVYANANWFNNYLNKDVLKSKYSCWIAHYGVNPKKYESQYDMLQYTSSGAVSGINGRVDMNEMYKDLINDGNTFKDGEEVILDIPLGHDVGNDKVEVESYGYKFVVHKSLPKIHALGTVVCYLYADVYRVKIFDDEFDCKAEYMSKK